MISVLSYNAIHGKRTKERSTHMPLRKIILTALFAALTFVGTFFIKMPTPTLGYVHPGDAFVLLSGILLGPLYGGFAAGFGSMLSDLFGGYLMYAPATFIIKAITALIAGVTSPIFRKIARNSKSLLPVIIGSALAEAFMTLGYFVFEIFLLALTASGSLTKASISAGIAGSAAGVPFNMVQALFGIVIALLIYPVIWPAIQRQQSSASRPAA